MTLRDAVADVVASGNCTGCGGCAALSPAISMGLDDRGYLRPAWTGDGAGSDVGTEDDFAAMCPGISVRRPRPEAGGSVHPVFGRHVSVWRAWAGDDDVRRRGSSGGVLTALSGWLLETGEATRVVGAGMSGTDPRRTVPVALERAADVLDVAGSRYAPVGTLAVHDPAAPGVAVVGKPCEAVAARALAERSAAAAPVILSFFCAGVPSQHATDDLARTLSGRATVPVSLRYRGDGWPGRFVVEDDLGGRSSASYEDSWGRHLGPTVQDRCKICPDGTGEAADVAVGDYWISDGDGYPRFDDAAGESVAIARTARGHALLMAARDAGVVVLEPADLDDVERVQPLQVRRHRELGARVAGRRLAGRTVPRLRGFGQLGESVRRPRQAWRAFRGSLSRARRR